ncbi:MAG: Gfo/Idh/MocA family oxidoreductase, partial [Clostridia bacterium]|nr:Gfo/Idh/MocA family oxidoreductase [Clostridia bacterium]
MKIGIVGCGNISGIYLKNLTAVFKNITVVAVADLDAEKAKKAAETYGIPQIMTLDEMLACPEIEMILNITTPGGHYNICKKALLAGKHVYVEKPLSLTYAEGKELIALAKEKSLYVGCAPDTFMGA